VILKKNIIDFSTFFTGGKGIFLEIWTNAGNICDKYVVTVELVYKNVSLPYNIFVSIILQKGKMDRRF